MKSPTKLFVILTLIELLGTKWNFTMAYSINNHFRMVCKWLQIAKNCLRIMVCESPRSTWESFLNVLQVTKDHWESLRITKNHFRIIIKFFMNHWELLKNHLRMVYESLRITWESFQNGLWITENHQLEKHFRMVSKSLRITKNCLRIISEWLNHWESPKTAWESFQNVSNHLESSRIAWESFQKGLWITKNYYKMVHESPRIARESFKNVSRMTENHIKTLRSYIFNGPQPNDTHALRSYREQAGW